jgi:hypothetical protein
LKLIQPSHRSATVDFSESLSSLSFRRLAKTRRRRSVGRRSSFQRAFSRVGLIIFGPPSRFVKPRTAPTRERNLTARGPGCQPPL